MKQLIPGGVTRERFQMKFQMKFQKDRCILELFIYPLRSSHYVSLTVIFEVSNVQTKFPSDISGKSKWLSNVPKSALRQGLQRESDHWLGEPWIQKGPPAMGLLRSIRLKNCLMSFALYSIAYPITIDSKSGIIIS
jgi:hypothetical protein